MSKTYPEMADSVPRVGMKGGIFGAVLNFGTDVWVVPEANVAKEEALPPPPPPEKKANRFECAHDLKGGWQFL